MLKTSHICQCYLFYVHNRYISSLLIAKSPTLAFRAIRYTQKPTPSNQIFLYFHPVYCSPVSCILFFIFLFPQLCKPFFLYFYPVFSFGHTSVRDRWLMPTVSSLTNRQLPQSTKHQLKRHPEKSRNPVKKNQN